MRDEFGEFRIAKWHHIWWAIADGFSALSPTLPSVCSPAACPGIMQKGGSIRHAERMLCQGRALPPGMSRRRAADHAGRSPGVQRSGRSPSRTGRETSRAWFLASSISTQIQPIFATPLLPVCCPPEAERAIFATIGAKTSKFLKKSRATLAIDGRPMSDDHQNQDF